MKSSLSGREQKVLWATVNRYIATAEPVGSKVLVEEYDFNISPATIRNVMSALDRSGFLYQPHTSSGRVPSDSGYRVYVDELINPQDLSDRASQLLASKFEHPHQSLEALLRSVAQLLATLSGSIAIVTAPDLQPARLKHIQLVLVEATRVMAIAISDTYHMASALLEIPSDLRTKDFESDIQTLTNFLNAHLRDVRVADLPQVLNQLHWHDLDREMQRYAVPLQQSVQQLSQACCPPSLGQVFISGLSELLRQPEFTQMSQVLGIVQLLEEDRAALFPLILEQPGADSRYAVSVKIGTEIPLEPIQHCSLISATYHLDSAPVGSVGVLGPTRINYERAISSVQATAIHLSESLAQRS